jgi:hypothetical protein
MKKIKFGMPILMEFDNIEDNVKLAHELGLDFVELNLNMLYSLPSFHLARELEEYVKMYGMEFTLHYYDTVDISSINQHYQTFLYTDFEHIGSLLSGIIKRLVVHIEPGAFMTIHGEKNHVYAQDQGYIDRTLNTLIHLRSVLGKYQIELMLENVPIRPWMEELYHVINNHGFKFCWDTGHDRIYENYLFTSFREKYNLNIRHMHLHNVLNGKDHQALDVGEIDIDNRIEIAADRDAYIVVEVKDSINLRKSIDYLEKKGYKKS